MAITIVKVTDISTTSKSFLMSLWFSFCFTLEVRAHNRKPTCLTHFKCTTPYCELWAGCCRQTSENETTYVPITSTHGQQLPSPCAAPPNPAPGNNRSFVYFYTLDYFPYERNCALLVLLCLAYFAEHNVFQVHPPCCKWQLFLRF